MTAAEADARTTVVIAGPPTSNGDLHVGHVAGPYVGADVHVRYLRAVGRDVVFASCGDDYQTFVVTAAARLGTTPPELVATSWTLIKAAELVAQNVQRLRAHAQRALTEDLDRDTLRLRLGDLFLQVRALIACSAPILVDLAGRVADLDLRMSAGAFDVAHTTTFSVPSLDLRTGPAGHADRQPVAASTV